MNGALREVMLPAFDEGDRPMSVADLFVVEAQANVRHMESRNSEGPVDLLSFALSLGCATWLQEPRTTELMWPVAEPLTPAFAYNLLQQMGSATGQAAFFGTLAELCYQLAAQSVGERADVANAAFFAGLQWGQATGDRHQERADQLQRHLGAIQQARADAQITRKQTFERQALAKEQALLALAVDMIAANPFTTDKDVQQLYREQHGLPDNTSNAEAKVISRLRREGRLPARR